jgi:Ca2+-binding EF-hand superfamily protein
LHLLQLNMKTKLTLLTALAGLLTLTNAGAQADGTRPGRNRGNFQPSAEDLKKYDKDGDGQLSQEERTAMREARQKEMLEKYDADKDGKLNEEETKKMREENPGRGGRGGAGGFGGGGTARGFQPSPEDLKKYDKDGDGKLSGEEVTAMREARQKEMLEKYDADKDGKLNEEETKKMRAENPGRGFGGGFGGGAGGAFQPTPEVLKKYDKDADGKLSDEERRAWFADRQKEMLEKYDADKDGKLSPEERTKMMEEMRRERGAGGAGGGSRVPEPTKPADSTKPAETKPATPAPAETKPAETKGESK